MSTLQKVLFDTFNNNKRIIKTLLKALDIETFDIYVKWVLLDNKLFFQYYKTLKLTTFSINKTFNIIYSRVKFELFMF